MKHRVEKTASGGMRDGDFRRRVQVIQMEVEAEWRSADHFKAHIDWIVEKSLTVVATECECSEKCPLRHS